MTFTAIFGGTFNPLHIGHYEMLRALQETDFIDSVLVMPDRIPPHKTSEFLARDEDRVAMCRIAAADFDKARLCLIEFEREGKSYSFDTVTLLKERYPGVDFAFVCGGDSLITLDLWYRYRELIAMLPFIVFRRTDTDSRLFEQSVARFEGMGAKIIVMDKVIPAVSSTGIRQSFAGSRALLPEKIHTYLTERGIYHAGKA